MRYLAPFLFWFLLVRRASVSFTWRATASSSTSRGFWLRLRFLPFLPLPPLPPLLALLALALLLLPLPFFFLLRPLLLSASALMSTRSFPMRWRFFFSPFLACAFSSRSFRFSSLVFFLGRVLWLMASRSILPSTLTLGALGFLASVGSLKTPAVAEAFSAGAFSWAGASGAFSATGAAAGFSSFFSATGAATGFSALGASLATGFSSLGASTLGSAFFSSGF